MTRLDPAAIGELCRAATARSGDDAVIDLVVDDLDASIWVRLSCEPRAREVLAALTDHGMATTQHPNCRLRVTGWDARLLRRRLGMLLAGVDDLTAEWDATAELARYHYDRRARATGQPPETWEVLADIEATMRSAVPIPHHAPAINDLNQLRTLIAAAEEAYQQLIARHIDHAEAAITAYQPAQHHGAA